MELENKIQNGMAEGFCLIKSAEKKVSSKKLPYLDLVLTDAGGEMPAKLWDYSAEKHGEYAAGMVVKVRGSIDMWNNAPQLRVDRIRRALPEDGVDMSTLTPCAPYDAEWMFDELVKTAESFEDEDLKKIVLFLLQKGREAIIRCPAAVKMHHAVRGGLLFHTLSIVRVAQRICEVYPFLNRDLLLSGILLHDLGKTEELDVNEAGTAGGYTPRGNLIGHLVGGAINLQKAGEELGADPNKVTLLQHMVLSHHGVPEFGSPIPPMFPEAEVLSQLDNLDATLFEMCQALEKASPGSTTGKVWGLDRKLFCSEFFTPGKGAQL